MTPDDVAAIVTALGDLTRVVREADPADKSEIYTQLGLTLTYQPGKRLVEAAIKPSLNVRKGFVSEGDLNPGTGEISLIMGLNSKTGEESPNRGSHAVRVAGGYGLCLAGFVGWSYSVHFAV